MPLKMSHFLSKSHFEERPKSDQKHDQNTTKHDPTRPRIFELFERATRHDHRNRWSVPTLDWNSKTRETRWKPPPMWECKAKSIEAAAETGDPNVKISKPSFKKSGKGLFKSSAGTNNTTNASTSGLKRNSAFAKTLSWKGADDGKTGSKRSNDVAYGTWVPKKVEEVQEEVKQETAESLGLPPEADAFYEEEANDKEKYKGFTFKEDRFQVGGEKQAEVISIEEKTEPVPFKKKKFGGNTRQRKVFD